MYSIKARAILHAHLSRMPLNPETLERDRQFVVKKCPYLVQEMVSCVHQLVMMAYARRVPRLPSIETIENCMKMSPMIIQGLWEFKSPLLQLPHLTEDHLYFMNKKRHVKNLQQFAQLKPEESRQLLKNLSDFEYENTMKVLGKMPLIDFSIRCEVIDDENTNVVTAGAIVTVTVTLERKDMKTLFGDTKAPEKQGIKDETNEEAAGDEDEAAVAAPVKKASAWAKPRKGGKERVVRNQPRTKRTRRRCRPRLRQQLRSRHPRIKRRRVTPMPNRRLEMRMAAMWNRLPAVAARMRRRARTTPRWTTTMTRSGSDCKLSLTRGSVSRASLGCRTPSTAPTSPRRSRSTGGPTYAIASRAPCSQRPIM